MEKYVKYVIEQLNRQKIVLSKIENENIEIADFGLNNFEKFGLGILTYVNNESYCAKELVMLPNQICPEHRHPPVGDYKGKQETFRCRNGQVTLYVDYPTNEKVLDFENENYTAKYKIVLNPGEQFTIPRNTKHWFQASNEGAIISEFSTKSIDEKDIFTDPLIRRVE